MQCTVVWQGSAAPDSQNSSMAFTATTGSGHQISIDGPPELGGANLGARPMELLLAGAGGCSAVDVLMILQKGRNVVTACRVNLDAERAEREPKVFTRIHFHYTVSGHELRPAAVERAISLSKEKYCSATIMLGHSAQITHSVDILESGPPQESQTRS